MSTLRESFERASLPALTFLNGLPRFVPFLGILEIVERVVEAHEGPATLTRASLAAAESWARDAADHAIAARQ